MTRQKKEPLRKLTKEEQEWLERINLAHNEPAGHVARAKEILAVAEEKSYIQEAEVAGRKSGGADSQLIRQFNKVELRSHTIYMGWCSSLPT